MRIIGGSLKGRTIRAPDGQGTRPTSYRAREALFNILAHAEWAPDLSGARVIDAFAGSGSLGFEAISRGAAFCLFVETDAAARGCIRDNVETFQLFGNTRIHRRSATDLGAKPAGVGDPFNLVFLDPPSRQGLVPLAMEQLVAGQWLSPDALVVAEIGSDEPELSVPGWEEPSVGGMATEGCRYVGFLYVGVMVAADGPKVLEYNCRLGDPETQPLIMRLRSDLVELCGAALDGQLHEIKVEWDPRPALGVEMTAAGYPGAYRKGDVIEGLPRHDGEMGDVKLFHAGTLETKEGHIVTHGGRVRCATALGGTVAEAQSLAYNLVKRVCWDGVYYRTDIGYRAIARERGE